MDGLGPQWDTFRIPRLSQTLYRYSILKLDLVLHQVLDTALDIAKAMLHLHMADVLHGDLKVWTRLYVWISSGHGLAVGCRGDYGGMTVSHTCSCHWF